MPAQKLGSEFLVNTTTAGDQNQADVTALSDGRFLVTWAEKVQDYSYDVRAQVFNAAGVKSGAELLVSTQAVQFLDSPVTAPLAAGRFVVAWRDWTHGGYNEGGGEILAQLFNADGSKSGTEIAVNTQTVNVQQDPAIATLSDGRFVVTWTDLSETGPNWYDGGGTINIVYRSDVRAQVFDATGAKSGAELVLSTNTSWTIAPDPSVAALANGGFVVAYRDGSPTDAQQTDIYAQLFLANGATSGSPFRVNTVAPGAQSAATVTTLADGHFVVAWTDGGPGPGDPSAQAVRAQVFNSDGSKSGGEFLVNTTTANAQSAPTITALADGRFVAAWTDASQTGSDPSLSAVRAQIFNANGLKSGPEFLVNTTALDKQLAPTLATLPDGHFVAAWTDASQTGADTTGLAVRAQLFDPDAVATNDVLHGTPGPDQLSGGLGDDWYFVDNPGDVVTEHVDEGAQDRVFASISYALPADAEIEKLSTTDHAGSAAISLTGNRFANTIYGNAGPNVLDGKGGADTLLGLDGNDFYYVDNALDRVIEQPNGGNDRVFASVSYTLPPGQEIERLSTQDNFGTAPINLTGNDLPNAIYGNAGPNILDGKGGPDSLNGFGGDDRYFVDPDDVVNESPGGGFDRVLARASYTLKSDQEIELLATDLEPGRAPINLSGNNLDNIICGNAGSNALKGGFGNDTLVGLGDRDAFVFNTPLDAVSNVDRIVDFAPGEDQFVLASWIFTALPSGAPAGALTPEAFRIGPAAADPDDRIIYNGATGALSYDADGAGGASAILFARLDHAPAISSADFLVV